MRAWQFSKPKNPGFGISRGFYLSVLSSKAVLPSIAQVANAQGAGGAVEGFGVPLVDERDKALLHRPLERGAYALATRDRKTVLKMLVISKEEAGYDPEAYAMSAHALDAGPELVARMRGTWTLAQLTFEAHDPMVYPALDFLLDVAVRLAELTEGVAADPLCRRYRLPDQVRVTERADPRVDVREHVVVDFRERPDGLHAYTLGMQKFALPELEITGLLESDHSRAARFLGLLGQTILLGSPIRSGERFGAGEAPFEAREGGFDRSFWEGIEVLELLPPTRFTASEALDAWSRASA